MSTETLTEKIANLIAVGWRKLVDGEGSGQIYNVLNPAFTNNDPRIANAAHAHVVAIGEATAPLLERNAPDEEIARAMKKAACTLVPKQEGEHSLTVDNAGKEMLKQILPLEWYSYGKMRIVYASYSDNENSKYLRVEMERDGEWKNFRPFDEERQEYVGAVLLKLVNEIPAVKEYFKESLKDKEEQFRIELQKAAEGVTDDGWLSLANGIKWWLSEEAG